MGSTLLTVPPLALDFATSASPAKYGVRNKHRMVRFEDSATSEAFWSNFMPEGYVGSDLSVTIAWAATSAIVGDVVWDVAFERLAAGSQDLDSDSFNTPEQATDTTQGTSGQLKYTTIPFTNAEADGIQPNESFRIRIRRLGADVSDDMVGDAEVYDVTVNQVAFAGTLTVEEQDGNPSVTGVRTIKFDNTTVTDEGGDVVSVASGGGGGGFFTDGAGTNAGIGKGTVAPTAAGANALAHGDGSDAGGDNAGALGKDNTANGDQSFMFGLLCLDGGFNNNFGAGNDITFQANASESFSQGLNNDTFGGDTYYQRGTGHFNQGKDNSLENHYYRYYHDGFNPYYYEESQAGFVQGVGNTISGDQSTRGCMVQGTTNTLTEHNGAWIFGNNCAVKWVVDTLVCGAGHDLNGSSNNTILNAAVFGQDHYIDASCARITLFGDDHVVLTGTRNISMFGNNHTMDAGVNEATILGFRGKARNSGAFVHAAGVDAAQGNGRFQRSVISNAARLTSATANQTLETFLIPNAGAFFLDIKVAAHYSSGNDEDAIFYYNGHLLVNKVSGTGNVQFTEFGGSPGTGSIVLTKTDAGGTNVGTLIVNVIPNGTTGFLLRASPPNTDQVYFQWEISLVEVNLA